MLHTKKTDSFKSQHTQKETNIDSITNLATPMSDIRFLLRKGPKTANLQMHGALADPGWDDPVMVAQCSEVARPGYDSVQAHEYLDTPRTLKLKVKLLAKMLKKSSATVLYTGAGISTASGMPDYASKAKKSLNCDISQNGMVQNCGGHCGKKSFVVTKHEKYLSASDYISIRRAKSENCAMPNITMNSKCTTG